MLQVGAAVRNWKPGDRVTVHCNHVDDQDPTAHDDSMLAANQRIWGFETNFGGLADLSIVKANQLMPKPTHLSWEEAAVNALCSSTSYRMLVGDNGARMKQGDSVLIWGATGGIGGYAVQYVLNGGGTPIGVVSSPERAELLEQMGCEAVIDRRAEGYQFWSDEHTQDESRVAPLRQEDPRAQRRRGRRHRLRAPGRRRWAPRSSPSSGRHRRDLRGHVRLHGRVRQPPLLDEAEAADRVALRQLPRGVRGQQAARPGQIQPIMSDVYSLDQVGDAALAVHHNEAEGKLGVLCLAPAEGLGIDDPGKRERSARTRSPASVHDAAGEAPGGAAVLNRAVQFCARVAPFMTQPAKRLAVRPSIS